jgi:predicted GIY-YIG superfamily endonuclease
MHCVYLIRSINFPDKTYIGLTDNLTERLNAHNHGSSLHTKTHRPWRLEVFIGFDDKFKAAAFEKYLKSHSGRSFASKRFW